MTFSQTGQRRTAPGAWVNARRPPTSLTLPQVAHSVGLAVISSAKISCSTPATALPSSMISRFISLSAPFTLSSSSRTATRRPESLCANLVRRHPDLNQTVRRRLDQKCRAADKCLRILSHLPGHFAQHLMINPAGIAGPTRRLGTGERVNDLQTIAGRTQLLQLVGVNDVFGCPRAV